MPGLELVLVSGAFGLGLLGRSLLSRGGESRRAAAQAALQASEERYRTFIEQTAEGVWRIELRRPLQPGLDEDAQIDHFYAHALLAECNDVMARMYGYQHAAELVGARLGDLLPRSDPHNVEYLRAFIRSGYRLTDAESHERSRGGEERYFLNNLIGIVERGRLVRAWGSQRDVTANRLAEAAVRESEARLSFALEAGQMGTFDWPVSSGQVVWSPTLERLHGYEPGTLSSTAESYWTRLHPDDRARAREQLEAILAGAGDPRLEYRVVRPDGEIRWLECFAKVFRDESGRAVRLVGVCADITERKRAQAALRESEARLSAVIEQMPVGVLVAEAPSGRIIAANREVDRIWRTKIVGSEDLTEFRVDRGFHPDGRAYRPEEWPLMRTIATGEVVEGEEIRVRRGDNTDGWLRVTAGPIRDADGRIVAGVAAFQDITERKRSEERLREADRMDAVGQLAGGMAHEANNQMAVVLGATDFILRRTDVPEPVRQDVEYIQQAANRTAMITRQLLAFSRRQVLQPQVVNLNQVLENLELVLRRTLTEVQELSVRTAPALKLVRADPGQIEQVLLNLVLNARDAMPRGGRVTLETRNVELSPEYVALRPGTPVGPGPYVMLAVSDTGVGIDAETLRHIFEPFFTTKGVGRGTGLGLSMVYGIVKQSGGYIFTYSEPGRGTTFKIYLPAVEAEVPSLASRMPAAAAAGESVLVVEDDPLVRVMMARTLRERGYTVLEAEHGRAALDVASEPGTQIDLVVTDLAMPDLDGGELAARLTGQRPEIPVLFISGYTDDDVVRRGLLQPDRPFLAKPFAPETLAEVVGRLLAAARGGAATP